jgi:MFS family permease
LPPTRPTGTSAIFVGRWVDRYGSRGVTTMGSCLGVTLLVLWPRVTTPVAFYLIWGGLGIVSAMVVDRFGTKAFGQINGVIAFLLPPDDYGDPQTGQRRSRHRTHGHPTRAHSS